ncbi:MAG: NAD(P)/FAD-dependent oxidoreductase [Anaerolineae bacterium]
MEGKGDDQLPERRAKRLKYDAIVVGASFAGLAVAGQLKGKILLLDRKEIGTGQTSACGTLLSVIEALGAEECVLQVQETIVLHTTHKVIEYRLTYPFCTFDYGKLCRLLAERTTAEFVRATVRGVNGRAVITNREAFTGRILVDASGWRAALGREKRADLVDRSCLNFGLETLVAWQDDGLHFWYDPPRLLPKGVTWLFPCGDKSRIGIGSYVGETKLCQGLEAFLGQRYLEMNSLHGGYFPYALRQPTVGNIFLVGDAAGQCLGFTGEGIRNALYFGTACGRIVQRVIEGQVSLEDGLAEYRLFVERHRLFFSILFWVQKLLTNLPLPLMEWIMVLASRPSILHPVMRLYERAFDPALLINQGNGQDEE